MAGKVQSVIVINGGTAAEARKIEKAAEWEVKVIRDKKKDKNTVGQVTVKIFR